MPAIGIDLSPGMIAVARQKTPALAFTVGSMLKLPAADGAWAGAIALYSIIHLTAGQRAAACGELARVVRRDGWILIAFHIDSPEFAAGDVNHITNWFGNRSTSTASSWNRLRSCQILKPRALLSRPQ